MNSVLRQCRFRQSATWLCQACVGKGKMAESLLLKNQTCSPNSPHSDAIITINVPYQLSVNFSFVPNQDTDTHPCHLATVESNSSNKKINIKRKHLATNGRCDAKSVQVKSVCNGKISHIGLSGNSASSSSSNRLNMDKLQDSESVKQTNSGSHTKNSQLDQDQEDLRKKRCTDRYDSSESSDR